MSIPTIPREAYRIAFSTMIEFCRSSNVRSIIRISPARTCGYSRLARSRPREAAMMMWSRSRSPPRLRFIGLKRSSSVVIPCERYAPPIAPWTDRSTASGLDDDDARETRQLGVVDAHGRAASWTGSECNDWAGDLQGEGFAAQGNIL